MLIKTIRLGPREGLSTTVHNPSQSEREINSCFMVSPIISLSWRKIPVRSTSTKQPLDPGITQHLCKNINFDFEMAFWLGVKEENVTLVGLNSPWVTTRMGGGRCFLSSDKQEKKGAGGRAHQFSAQSICSLVCKGKGEMRLRGQYSSAPKLLTGVTKSFGFFFLPLLLICMRNAFRCWDFFAPLGNAAWVGN